MAVDLGKQMGPLPLGAWIAVVGTGLAVALYSRNTAGGGETQYVEDVSGVPGVGTGEVGGWVPTSPAPVDPTVIADNIAWQQQAVNGLISRGYDSAIAYQAITKALASGEAGELSVGEWTLWRLALMYYGAPPEPVFVTEPGSSIPTEPPPAPPEPPPPPPAPVTVPAPAPSQDPSLAATASMYLANFQRADYWYGAAADAARQWLIAHGFGVPGETLAAWRLHYLRTHDAMADAYKRGDAAFKTFMNNHLAMKADWIAHGGTMSTSEFRWRF